jgi:hypothetical protein
MRRIMWLSVLLILAGASPAQAQDFSTVLARARVGDHLFVTDRTTGVEVSGTLTSLGPSELRIDGYVFACLNRSNWHCALRGGLAYSLVGAAIDGMHAGRTTIFRTAGGGSVGLAPRWTRHGRGVALTIAFR